MIIVIYANYFMNRSRWWRWVRGVCRWRGRQRCAEVRYDASAACWSRCRRRWRRCAATSSAPRRGSRCRPWRSRRPAAAPSPSSWFRPICFYSGGIWPEADGWPVHFRLFRPTFINYFFLIFLKFFRYWYWPEVKGGSTYENDGVIVDVMVD